MSRAAFIARRAAVKRAAILAAAQARFAADGFEGASVERIAAMAQVSTATLYRLFSSKAALFTAVMQEGLADFEAALAASAGETPLARLQALATAYAALLSRAETAGLLRALMQAAPTQPDLAADFYEGVKSRLAGAFHAAAAEALPTNTDNPGAPGAMIMGMVEHQTVWRRLLTGAPSDRAPEAIGLEAVAAAQAAFKA